MAVQRALLLATALVAPATALAPTPRTAARAATTTYTATVAEPEATYWNDVALVDELSAKAYARVAQMVSRETLVACSRGAAEAFERGGGHEGM